jgi:hypothetical protein
MAKRKAKKQAAPRVSERERKMAQKTLDKIKPFDQWKAERPRTAADERLYRDVIDSLTKIASGDSSAATTITARFRK